MNDNDELCQIDIGNDCYVVVKPFKSEMLVHVRKYDKQNEGGLFPTKKGNHHQLREMEETGNKVAQFIEEEVLKYRDNQEVDYMTHLGGNYYVTLKKGTSVSISGVGFYPRTSKKLSPLKL